MSELTPYELLANAIVARAAEDWRQAVRKLKRNSENLEAIRTKAETERFFLSDRFCTLTEVSGEALLEKLKEEAEE